MTKQKLPLIFFVLFLLLVASMLAGFLLGSARFGVEELWNGIFGENRDPSVELILFELRLPRVIGALLAGGGLAVAGLLLQSATDNDLCSPSVIGVNAGAGLAVTLCCALAPAAALQPLAAFAGAMAGVVLVLVFAEATGASRMTLVLAGVAISNLFTALIDAVTTIFPDALLGYADFRMGGLAGVTMARLGPAAVLIGVSLALAVSLAGLLEILSLGPETAQSLGVAVRPVRLLFLALAAALAGSAVSVCGLVGFVGLLVPHAVRAVFGGESRRLLVCSALGGAAFLTLCDLIARAAAAPFELPVGTVLSVVGGPFFLWLLVRQRGGRTHDRTA